MSRSQTIRRTLSTVKHLGPQWAVYRLGYAVKKRCGVLKRATPVGQWADYPLDAMVQSRHCLSDYRRFRAEGPSRFLFDTSQRRDYQVRLLAYDTADVDRTNGGESAITIADDVCDGWFRYFETQRVQLGAEPDWHANPFGQQRLPAQPHWSELNEFGFGDIKLVWEPNRFAFVYPLVRAYWRTGDDKYAHRFWQLLESWAEQNPPHQGANWKCGQEVALRLMAWCFAMYGFADCQPTTSATLTRLLQLIAVSTERIAANIQYALSQKNNHGISEAAGLFTVGMLFPELRDAEQWLQVGRRHLECQAQELIYDDGAFSQHSANYHRVMLQLYTWCLKLGERNGCRLSDVVYQRVAAAAEFLYQIQDRDSGCVPRYGQYDGALVLPLSNVSQANFRPAIQAALFATTGEKPFSAGAHDEELLWLCGPEAVDSPVTKESLQDLTAGQGGCHTIRGDHGFAFVRSGSFEHRPSQADMLHCDIWWRGLNMALDPGTYSYSAPAPWNNPFAGTAYHNTVTVDGQDQMQKAGRFLWLPWIRSQSMRRDHSADGRWSSWESGHDGYQRKPFATSYRRGVVRIGAEHWLVLDRLQSKHMHRYRLHWSAPDFPSSVDAARSQVELATPLGPYQFMFASSAVLEPLEVVRADPASPVGWYAPTYFQRQPCQSIALNAVADSILFATVAGPNVCGVELSGAGVEVHTGEGTTLVEISPCADQLIKHIVSAVST